MYNKLCSKLQFLPYPAELKIHFYGQIKSYFNYLFKSGKSGNFDHSGTAELLLFLVIRRTQKSTQRSVFRYFHKLRERVRDIHCWLLGAWQSCHLIQGVRKLQRLLPSSLSQLYEEYQELICFCTQQACCLLI